MVGLGQPETTDQLALRHTRQIAVLLLLGTPRINRVHRERALHRGKGSQARIRRLELLHDQPVGDVFHPGASVTLEIRAEDSQFGQFRDQIERKALARKMALDVRHHLAPHELTHRIASHPILGTEQFVEVVEVQIHQGTGHFRVLKLSNLIL